MSDYAVNTDVSARLCQDPDHRYWSDFVYPPPAVLLWLAFEKLGYPAGATVWLAFLGTSLAGSFILALRITSVGTARQAIFHAPSGAILALAFASTEYYSLWDLHVVNTNSIYLFLVLAAIFSWLNGRGVLAGILLGASVALKIYSVVFLPFLLLRREGRIAMSMMLAMMGFFVALPVAYFGAGGALQITENWLRTVLSAGGHDYLLHYSGYKISLAWVTMLILDPRASAGQLNLFTWSPEAVAWLLRLVHITWLLFVAGYFFRATSLPLSNWRGRLALSLDASLLLLLTLPLSPFLQPPHPVVLLLPAVALLRYCLEGRATSGKRLGAALTVASGCFVELTHFPWRGIGVMLTVAVFFAGIWMVRRDLEKIQDAPENKSHSPSSSGQQTSRVAEA